MAINVARYLNSLAHFAGHVVLVTGARPLPGCDSVSAPNEAPSAAAAGPPPADDVTAEGYHWSRVKLAERAWLSAFQKWAPRLKLSVLNVTRLSETRADARPPGDCGGFCLPGLPHVWAEAMLRLLEQHHEVSA